MRLLILLALAASAWGQTAIISDTLTSAVGGGTWTGRIVVALNSPTAAQPLYSGTTSLAGWSSTYCVGVTGTDCTVPSAAGVFLATLYTNDTITPAGTSYSARYAPSKGSPWSETWTVSDGDTKLYQIRSTTTPTPTATYAPSQISSGGANSGDTLQWNGTAWAPSAVRNNYVSTFTSQTSVSVPVADHAFQSAALVVECFNAASPAALIDCAISVNPSTYEVTASFATAQSGKIVINGADFDHSSNYSESFTAQTTVTATAAEHGYTTSRILAQCYTEAGVALDCAPSVNASTFDVTVTFPVAQTGKLILTGR